MQTSKTRATLRLIESLMPKHPLEETLDLDRMALRSAVSYGRLRISLPDTGAPSVVRCECSRCRAAKEAWLNAFPAARAYLNARA